MKKKEWAGRFAASAPGLLACPLCREALGAREGALACPRGHSFDISASGYVNLLAKAVHADYGAGQLESRSIVCHSGFFDLLIDELGEMIYHHAAPGSSPLRVLDAGCGEGSQLSRLAGLLKASMGQDVEAIGADISKEGIRIAARDYAGILWLVADLARLPVAPNSIDVILNILSPSNYAEFDRVLKDDGLLIKAVPGEDYLKELRLVLYAGGERERYTNEKVLSLFESSYDVIEVKRIRQSFEAPPGLWPHIVAMTPMTWGAGQAGAERATAEPQPSVTLDFVLLAGRKRRGRKEGAHDA